MIGHSMTVSVISLVFCFGILGYALYSFAHVQVNHANVEELNKLVEAGVLTDLDSGRLVANYKLVHARVEDLAPVICMRREFWLYSYFQLVRCARWLHPSSGLDRELLYLNAFQAHHYWVARQSFEAFTNQAHLQI
ncbi:MAG: hypothetical protein ACRD1Y_08390 [Terriglobales bacterium]